MTNFDQALQDLIQEIERLPLIQDYRKLKDEVEANELLSDKKREIQKWQRQMTLHLNDPQKHRQAKENYERLLAEYQAHPLVQNYQQTQEEVQDLLFQIKEILDQ